MLETLREFGLERMADLGEVSTVRAAHAQHFARAGQARRPAAAHPRSADLARRAQRRARQHRRRAALPGRRRRRRSRARSRDGDELVLGADGSPQPRPRPGPPSRSRRRAIPSPAPAGARRGARHRSTQPPRSWTGDARRGRRASWPRWPGQRPARRHTRPATDAPAGPGASAGDRDDERRPRAIEAADRRGDRAPATRGRSRRSGPFGRGWPRTTATPSKSGPTPQASLAEFRELGERWGMGNCLQLLAPLNVWSGDLDAGGGRTIREALDLFGRARAPSRTKR